MMSTNWTDCLERCVPVCLPGEYPFGLMGFLPASCFTSSSYTVANIFTGKMPGYLPQPHLRFRS